MKLVYSHPNFPYVGLMRSLLENNGIPSFIRNEYLSMLRGEIPPLEASPELWVADEDFETAQSIITQSRTHSTPENALASWTCPRCGAENEANMGLCWNCDYEIDGPNNPS
ncbi:hypothetical protein IAD21_03035 [Abditibacteriota bacterium]|nr:hypothetical protein IAD21_03035 [Abditibacteriota bacterium]